MLNIIKDIHFCNLSQPTREAVIDLCNFNDRWLLGGAYDCFELNINAIESEAHIVLINVFKDIEMYNTLKEMNT